ncbi:MAG: hypothetical protein DRQ55_07915 [Planctomycetota bacterium]|nr:MAG: hypothetical protein DRQ55_07915 [Planctomycetota bacterium]
MALKSLSTTELMRELERRQRGADRLLAKRDKVLAELANIDRELGALGLSGDSKRSGAAATGAPPRAAGGKRRRAKNAMSLPDALVQACEVGAVVSPAEASELVLANGFKTTSARFNMMVSNALAKDGRFKRIGRGQYERSV